MAFNQERRQKFLSERGYIDCRDSLTDSIQRARQILLTDHELTQKAKSRFRWRIAADGLELLVLNYTSGFPIDKLRDHLPTIIADFHVYIANEVSPRSEKPPRNVADTLEITQLEAYVYVFWLLALCKLLRHEELIPEVIKWVDKTFEFNRGRDGLFENVVQSLTGKHVPAERVLLHPLPYRPLARATVFAPDERPTLVKEFVETWYKHMKRCYWHGTHTDCTSYFGYWVFEAALVTVLFDVDDSSYRDHLVYPKDLVDWYRENSASGPRTPSRPKEMLKAMPGDPCPRSGEWNSPFLKRTVRVEKGQLMPGPQTDQSGNLVIWYLSNE